MSSCPEWKTRTNALLMRMVSFKSFINSRIRFFVQKFFLHPSKEIIKRGFLKEVLFFSLFSILLTIIMRILFTLEWRSLYPDDTTKYISIYILQQDCIGSLLICSGALFVRILVPENKIRLRATFLGFYFFLVAVCYISDLHYIRYSENHLLLSHLQEGGLDFDLWFFSIPKELELSWFFKLFLSGLAAWFGMYFYQKFFYQKQRITKTILLKLPYLFLLAFFLMVSSSIRAKLKADEALDMRVIPQNDEERILFYIKKSKEAKKRKESLNTFAALVYGYEETSFSLGGGREESRLDSSFKFRFDSSSRVERGWSTLIPIPKKKYNIVIYLFESTSRKYLNLMFRNRNVTPHWNELLENSIDFKSHYSGNPLSINALFSILTSAYSAPADFWIAKEFPDIPLLSLPEILKKHSYETAYFHSGRLGYAGQLRFLKNRGLDLIQEERDMIHHRYKKRINWGLDDRALISSVVQFAKKAKQPYCMVISPLSPHHPYEIPERKFDITSGWNNKKEQAIEKGVTNLTQEKKEYEETNHSFQNQIMNAPPQKRLSFMNYLNSLYYADFVMGTIVKELAKIPQKGEDTIFFIVADHGEGFGQHRRNYNHPFYLYEENVHVPFILFNRKLFSKNISYDSISRHIDILPTILDMIGIQADSKHEGLSLLKRKNHQIAPLYTSWRNHLAGLRDGKWKYIFNFQTRVEELYNLEEDPNETKNVVIQYNTIAKNYKKFLASLHDYQRKYFQTVLKRKINWKRKTDKTGL